MEMCLERIRYAAVLAGQSPLHVSLSSPTAIDPDPAGYRPHDGMPGWCGDGAAGLCPYTAERQAHCVV